jgi:hypothetical protein
MLRRQGMRKLNVSTTVSPALVTCIVTGLVLPSVAATSAPELDDSTMRWRYGNERGRQLRRPYFLFSANVASFSHSSAARSHASLSRRLTALSACWRHTSASLRNLVASSDIAATIYDPFAKGTTPKIKRDH